ncbi:MAG TPA: MarR family transcriptional regulator [Solirubrobacterales bacterium]|jgi:DNA-binding MarR family transcriptional regulator|nr:MarR family transcriptional regulator [Solirubrobacterales bacterium]
MTYVPKDPANWIPLPGLLDIASEALFAEFRAELERSEYSDIRPTHGCVFRFVQGEGLRLTEIAERAKLTKQSVGEIVDDLVQRGYAKRIPDPDDRRAKLICLTERGEAAQAHGRKLFAKVEKRWAQRYGVERIAALRELLEEIGAAEAPFAAPELAHAEPAAA